MSLWELTIALGVVVIVFWPYLNAGGYPEGIEEEE